MIKSIKEQRIFFKERLGNPRKMDKKKKLNRFNGLTEEEVAKNTLPDYLEHNLDLVFLGINPSLMAAHKGRYYAGPGNHFYKLLHASELVPRFVSFQEDANLLQYKIGLTNIVTRATRSSADLTTAEIKQGCAIVVDKMKKYKPKIAIFNGKCIYQPFAQQFGKSDFHFGLQTERIGDTAVWVVPSSSARCSNFPRMEDKLKFYQALKKHLMFLKGEIADFDLREFVFPNKPRERVSASKFWGKSGSSQGRGGIVKREEGSGDDDDRDPGEPEYVVMEILGGSQKRKEEEKSESDCETSGEENGMTSSSCLRTPQNCEKEADTSKLSASGESKKRQENEDLGTGIKANEGKLDFMNLIKRRILEKKENSVGEEDKTKPVKKSKYAHLRSKIK